MVFSFHFYCPAFQSCHRRPLGCQMENSVVSRVAQHSERMRFDGWKFLFSSRRKIYELNWFHDIQREIPDHVWAWIDPVFGGLHVRKFWLMLRQTFLIPLKAALSQRGGPRRPASFLMQSVMTCAALFTPPPHDRKGPKVRSESEKSNGNSTKLHQEMKSNE